MGGGVCVWLGGGGIDGRADSLIIPSALYDEMIAHLRRCYPEEGCGVLSGRDGGVTAVTPVTNVLHSQTRFMMDPAEQVGVMMGLLDRDETLLAIFHSHPHSAPIPSYTDRLEHAYPEALVLIVSFVSALPDMGIYRIKGHEVTAEDILIV